MFVGSKTCLQIASLAFNATLHHIWWERNQRFFNNSNRLKQMICSDIVCAVHVRTKLMIANVNSAVMNYLAECWDMETRGQMRSVSAHG